MVSLFLAKLLGFYLVIMALKWIFQYPSLANVVQSFVNNPALTLMSGGIATLGGLAILIGHPVWVMGWEGVITFLGLLILISGLIRIFKPEWQHRMAERFVAERSYSIIWGVVIGLLGLFLLYHGFHYHL